MQPDLSRIRWRLTRRYALISSLVLVVFGTSVYIQVAESRSRLMRTQVQQVASAAAAQMPLILHELAEYQGNSPQERAGERAEIGTLDSQMINLSTKRIVWFDSKLTELSRYGNFAPQTEQLIPVENRQQRQFITLGNGLAYWRPVFVRHSMQEAGQLKGYVFVALSTSSAEEELQRLRNGLLAGGVLGAITAVLLSQWMVASSIKPVRDQLNRLVRFTSDASHELRHPLTAIRAVIGSIQQGKLLERSNPALLDKLNLIDRAAGQMATLVDDLLLLARLDRTLPDDAHWIHFDLAELVEDGRDLFHERAQLQGSNLVGDLTRPAPVRGNPERLRQLLNNLLANALRFSPPNSTLTVELVRLGKVVQLVVEDEGPGIPPEQRQLVFERFWQADQARSGSHSGLGLALAQAIVQSHGGSLVAQSGRSGGCRMVATMPASKLSEQAAGHR